MAEEQVVPIWGYEDMAVMAATMLDTLNTHRPGECTELKNQLWRFLNEVDPERRFAPIEVNRA